jgi:hypothetical protein
VDTALFFAGLGVIVGGHRLWGLWRHPFGRCYWCDGSGRNSGSTADEYGFCKHCTSGRRVRVGARLVHPELRKGASK